MYWEKIVISDAITRTVNLEMVSWRFRSPTRVHGILYFKSLFLRSCTFLSNTRNTIKSLIMLSSSANPQSFTSRKFHPLFGSGSKTCTSHTSGSLVDSSSRRSYVYRMKNTMLGVRGGGWVDKDYVAGLFSLPMDVSIEKTKFSD